MAIKVRYRVVESLRFNDAMRTEWAFDDYDEAVARFKVLIDDLPRGCTVELISIVDSNHNNLRCTRVVTTARGLGVKTPPAITGRNVLDGA